MLRGAAREDHRTRWLIDVGACARTTTRHDPEDVLPKALQWWMQTMSLGISSAYPPSRSSGDEGMQPAHESTKRDLRLAL